MAAVVRRDSDDEAAERCVTTERTQRGRQSEEGVLHEILRRAGIAEQAPRERAEVLVMLVVDLAERGGISSAQPCDEIAAIGVHDEAG